MSAWRYIAQRATTGELLDLELPLHRDTLGWELSGSGSLRGTVTPDTGALRASDGRLLLEEWGTLIYAEADGEIRWGGIVVSSGFVGAEWKIEAAGFATYPHGLPYTALYSRIGVDPAEAFAHIWAHVQGYADGDLGVTVRGTSTPVRLGEAKVAAFTEVKIGAEWLRKTDVDDALIIPNAASTLAKAITATSSSLTLKTAGAFPSLDLPFPIVIGTETITVNARSGLVLSGLVRGVGTSKPAAHSTGGNVKFTGTASRIIPEIAAKPYELAWWEAPDCGQELDSLAQEASFDYTERHYWSGDEIKHEVVLGYPRLGRRRDDLAFVQGDNVVSVVSPELSGAEFANAVLGLGAGEGAGSIHRSTGVRDGRLRRVSVYTAKDVTSASRMDALIRDSLQRRQGTLTIQKVDVRDHPNAPIGSWSVGDDVLIEATLPWLGDVALWCRITGWELTSEHTASLSLARSDTFTYGG